MNFEDLFFYAHLVLFAAVAIYCFVFFCRNEGFKWWTIPSSIALGYLGIVMAQIALVFAIPLFLTCIAWIMGACVFERIFKQKEKIESYQIPSLDLLGGELNETCNKANLGFADSREVDEKSKMTSFKPE